MIRVDILIDRLVGVLLWPGRWLCGLRGHYWSDLFPGSRLRCTECGTWQEEQ